MKIVITGATGMVGKQAVSHFRSRGDEVVAVGRDIKSLNTHFGNMVACVATDYSVESLLNVLEGVDVVIHLAARRISDNSNGFDSFYQANVRVSENLLTAAGQCSVSRFCLASSISVYSQLNNVPFEEIEPPHPGTFYGLSKLVCEHLGVLYSSRFDIKLSSLRIARILGADVTGSNYFLHKSINLASKNQPLTIWGAGNTARDTIYVKDVVDSIECAVHPNAPTGVFNIGSGRAYSNLEIAETINEVFDNQGNIHIDPSKPEEGNSTFMDCTKANSELNWRPTWSLKKGLMDLRGNY